MTSPARRTSLLALLVALLGGVLLGSCDTDSTDENAFDGDVQTILGNEADGVLLPTYAALNARADTLQRTMLGLQDTTVRSRALDSARAAWRSARRPWTQSLGFRFGPTAEGHYERRLSPWPADTLDIRNVLAGEGAITEDRLRALPSDSSGAQRGFHAVEFLLFGADGDKTPDAFTRREVEYLIAATALLAADARALLTAWNDEGAAALRDVAPRAALQTLADAMATAAETVVVEGLAAPLAVDSAAAVPLIVSGYSGNTFLDLRNNVRSIRHVYTGDYNGRTGPGLDEIVIRERPPLDERLRQHIARAVTALGDLYDTSGSFRAALGDPDALREVNEAQRDVLALHDVIEQDLRPLLNETPL